MSLYRNMTLLGLLVISLTGCIGMEPPRPHHDNKYLYHAPAQGEDFALLRLSYHYTIMHDRAKQVGTRALVRHDGNDGYFHLATEQVHGDAKKWPRPEKRAIIIHAGKVTDIRLAVYFYWSVTRAVALYYIGGIYEEYFESPCIAEAKFTPASGRSYVVAYTAAGSGAFGPGLPQSANEMRGLFPIGTRPIFKANFDNNPNVNRGCNLHIYEQIPLGLGKYQLKRVNIDPGSNKIN